MWRYDIAEFHPVPPLSLPIPNPFMPSESEYYIIMAHLTVDIGGRPGLDCRGGFCKYCYFKGGFAKKRNPNPWL